MAGLLMLLFGALLELCSGVSVNRGGYPTFTDEIPFKITWPGAEFTLPMSGPLYSEENFVIMTTTKQERYKCLLPSLTAGDEGDEKDYTGPSPAQLLEKLFTQSSCSYRIESYWTYEVCHGKHIRQYHEEKETGQIRVQEYFLGKATEKSQLSETDKVEEESPKSAAETDVPTKNIEGQLTAYFPVAMGNGTPCTLRQNEARATTVLYVCHPEAKHEILSVAEVTTCEYEVVVLTPLLCSHPKYRFKSSPINAIFCQALAGSPLRPHSLVQLDKEQEEQLKPPFSSAGDTRESQQEAPAAREEAFTSTHKPITVGGQSQVAVGTTHISRLTDDQLIKEFLSGLYCLHGGVGWWKYEFCYGKHVHQYHEDKQQGKNIVVVGSWNVDEHIDWAKRNVARSYQLRDDGAQKVKLVSHFYGHGDVCDLTGKPRQVTVKLKCKESESPHAVTVYMLEPQTCQYVLGVESPVICRILDTADEYGLLSIAG